MKNLTSFDKTRISEIMVKTPVTADPETKVTEIARMMKDHTIGSVIIAEQNKPVGIMTERDIVSRVVALGLDPSTLKVSDVMSTPPVAVVDETPLIDAIDTMKKKKIRRIIVVDARDNITGILSIDDIGYNIDRFAEDIAIEYLALTQKIRDRRT